MTSPSTQPNLDEVASLIRDIRRAGEAIVAGGEPDGLDELMARKRDVVGRIDPESLL